MNEVDDVERVKDDKADRVGSAAMSALFARISDLPCMRESITREVGRAAIAAMQPQWRTDEMRAALEFIASGDGDPQLIAQQALDAIALPAPPAAPETIQE
jgi:hypothetical protein